MIAIKGQLMNWRIISRKRRQADKLWKEIKGHAKG